jgi:uncharacterized protein YjbI with pentapeptide repeats
MKGILKAIMIVVGIAALVGGAIWAGYRYAPDWTGFGEYQTPSNPDIERARRLWDWLELLIVPMAVVWGAWWLDRRQKETEREFEQARLEKDREIAQEKRYDATLEAYFDRMTALLLEEELRDSEEGDEVRTIARTRTLAVLRRLDASHNEQVLGFLREARLISSASPVISLENGNIRRGDFRDIDLKEVDLREVDLLGADLLGADLRGADLREADLRWADLRGTDLREADLREADLLRAELQGADLRWTDLSETYLTAANLRWADLRGADLREADLRWADLRWTDLREADLVGADLGVAALRGDDLPGADLRGADLRGADLREARNLNKADFEGAKLKGATVSARDVEALKSTGADVDGVEVVEESDEG